jgi:hypothetical protein
VRALHEHHSPVNEDDGADTDDGPIRIAAARHSAFAIRHSTFGIRHSAFGIC